MESYVWLKAAHVVAWTVWVATLLIVPLAARVIVLNLDGGGAGALMALRRVHSAVGIPAMLVAICLGLVLAQQIGAFTSTWLQLKFVLVVLLASLHGVTAGTLRRLGDSRADGRPRFLFRLSVAAGSAFLGIVVLAVAKPIA